MKPQRDCSKLDWRDENAFNVIELIVVLGVVALLGLLSLTALAHSQTSSDRAGCANNLRRLMVAWQMYPDDNSGALVANYSSVPGAPWVSGFLDYSPSNSDNTNSLKLTNAAYAALGTYVNSSSLYRCPADTTTLVISGIPKLRVRSYSMNGYVGSSSGWSQNFQGMIKIAEVSQPERIFVLIEEHPGSINDSEFFVDLASAGASAILVDYPSYFHLGGANLGMADGHVEYWHWSDARTMPPMNSLSLPLDVSSPNNPDVARLQAASSYLK